MLLQSRMTGMHIEKGHHIFTHL
ncbi:hypothetical protein CBM2626_A190007 [Cupriavidus taiwanensis]|nr:hypothetical protein CBM2626_A190007 [Cupriavidus taiwanensis]